MELFCKTERFKEMNVGFALDEGLANPTEAVSVYYGERSSHCELFHSNIRRCHYSLLCLSGIHVTCTGNPGHGSRFIENTAVEKVV